MIIEVIVHQYRYIGREIRGVDDDAVRECKLITWC